MRIKNEQIKRIEFADANDFIREIKGHVNFLIDKYYLSNLEVFRYWGEMIDISFEYIHIEYPENINAEAYNCRVRAAVEGMQKEITKNGAGNDFSEFLKELDMGSYF